MLYRVTDLRVIQRDLENLDNWGDLNKVTVNIKKTKCMTFGSNHKIKNAEYIPILLTVLATVGTYKYLGIFLDSNVAYYTHINEGMRMTSHKVHQLSRLKFYINKATALQVYNSMILPYFDYGDVLFMTATQKQLDRLQKMQNWL